MPQLFSRDFGLLVAGQVVSIIGSAVIRFALDLYVLDLTGRADVFAAVVALSALPGIVFTPIGGAIADRYSKRNLMVGLDATSGGLILGLFALMGAGLAPVPVIGVFLAALAVIASVYQPTVQASVPVLVAQERLASANGLVTGIGALAYLLGPVLGGVAYGFFGIGPLLIAGGCAFGASAGMEVFIRLPRAGARGGGRIVPALLGDVRDGVAYVARRDRVIWRVGALAATLNLFMSPVFGIGVPYVLRFTMRSSDAMYGIGLGICELASIVGAVTAGAATKRLRLGGVWRLIALAGLAYAPMALAVTPAMLGRGYWPSFGLFFASAVVALSICTMTSVYVVTEVQKRTPAAMMGKVMALLLTASQIAAPLGQILYGLAFEGFSQRAWLPVLGACAFTLAIAAAARVFLRPAAGAGPAGG
ncbi:MAG: MFS transporter [Bifidobacteriaceae bacterium]|jgi:MFS family permease|nr:MFS transporter [Bifidobacteriaceae bacterium]